MMNRYLAYKSSRFDYLGEIPSHWKATRLKFVTKILYGQSLTNEDRNNKDVPVYGSNGIVGYHDKAISEAPCIIIGRKGSFGKINFSNHKCYPIDTTFYIDPFATKHSIRWLYYTLLSLRLDAFTKDSAVPGLNREEIYENYIPLPPIEEQKLLAKFLDEKTAVIDKFIANKQRLIALLEEQKQVVINTAVTQGLDPTAPRKPSGIDWIGDIPSHWTRMAIKYSLNKIIDTEHKTAPFYDDGKYLVARTSNVKKGKLVFTDAKYTDQAGYDEWTRRGKPEPGDIIFTREAPAGEACIVPQEPILCIGQRTVLFKVNHDKLIPEFGVYSIYGGAASQFITLLSQGSTVAHFNMGDIGNIPMLLPPTSEQKEIVEYLNDKTNEIDAAIERAQREIELIEEYRTTLIAHAVTGKIDVRMKTHA